MTARPEVSPELTAEAEYPGSITPQELVGLIEYAGPGANIKVLSHHLAYGQTRVGQTTYQSDYTKGPAIYYFDDPRQRDWISGILPLGGEVTIIGPPKFNSNLGDRRVIPSILAGHANIVHTKPIDPYVDGQYRFTVITDEEFAAEEAGIIERLEEEEAKNEAFLAERAWLGLDLADSSIVKTIARLSTEEAVILRLKAGNPATALIIALGITDPKNFKPEDRSFLTESWGLEEPIVQLETSLRRAQEAGHQSFQDAVRLELLDLMKGRIEENEGMQLEEAIELLLKPIYDTGHQGWRRLGSSNGRHPRADGHSLLEIYAFSPESYHYRLQRHFDPDPRATTAI
jgi:hypothetical protein